MISLKSITEKGGRIFTIGKKDRSGNMVHKILKSGSYITVSSGTNKMKMNHILIHEDDLITEVKV